MKKILSLCIYLVILIISDSTTVKLIPGEKSVIKKDGVTHTISKYYVVPNDYNPNNVTDRNTTRASQSTTLHMNDNHHSKRIDSRKTKIDQVSEVNAANNKTKENNDQMTIIKVSNNHAIGNNVTINNIEVSSHQNETQVKVKSDVNTAESRESLAQEHNLDSLLVKPLTKFIDLSANVTIDTHRTGNALHKQSRRILKNATEINYKDEIDDYILTYFGTVVHELFIKNMKSFWKLVKVIIDRTDDDSELMAKIEKFTLLLNILTNLYEVVQSQKSIESIIEDIIDTLQIPLVEKRTTNYSQSENVSGHYNKDCLSCQKKCFKPQLVSNGTSLELEGRKLSKNLELKHPDLRGRLTDDSNNSFDDQSLNEFTIDIRTSNIPRSQLSDPQNLNTDIPDDYNHNLTTPAPTPNHVTRDNDHIQDLKSNPTFPDLSKTDDEQDDLPNTIESSVTVNQPLIAEFGLTTPLAINDKSSGARVTKSGIVEDKSSESKQIKLYIGENKTTTPKVTTNQPLNTVSVMAENEPFATESVIDEDQPFKQTIKSMIDEDQPLSTASVIAENQPVTTESRMTNERTFTTELITGQKSPVTTEFGVTNSIIAHKSPGNVPFKNQILKTADLPWHIEYISHENLPWYIDDKAINDRPWIINQKTTVVPWNVENRSGKKVLWNINNNKIDHSPIKWYQSGGPGDITHNSKIQLEPNQTRFVYRVKNEVRQPYHVYTYIVMPKTLHEITNSYSQPNYNLMTKSHTSSTAKNADNVVYTSKNPAAIYYESKILSKPTIEVSSQNTQPYSPSNVINVADRLSDSLQDNYKYKYQFGHGIGLNRRPPDFQLFLETQTNTAGNNGGQEVPREASSYLYHPTNSQSNYDKLNPGNSDHIDQHPGFVPMIPHDVIVPDYYDKPTLGNSETLTQMPGYISKYLADMVTAPNEYDNSTAVNRKDIDTDTEPEHIEKIFLINDEMTSDYGSDTPQNPSYISNVKNYNNPTVAYSEGTKQHPSLVPSVTNHSKFVDLLKYFDKSISVHVKDRSRPPEYISKASADAKYFVPNEYNNTTAVYSVDTEQHPNFILAGPHHPENINVINGKPISDYSFNVYQNPSYISKAEAHSEFTMPNKYNNPTVANSEGTKQHPSLVPSVTNLPKFVSLLEDYDKPNSVYVKDTPRPPGYISEASTHAESFIPNEYHNPTTVYSVDTEQHPGFIPTNNHYPENINLINDKSTSDYDFYTHQNPSYFSKTEAHSEFTMPNKYNNPTAVNSEDSMTSLLAGNSDDIDQHLGFVPMIPHHPEYTNDEYTQINGKTSPQMSRYISKASAHAKFNMPNEYPTVANSEDIVQHPGFIPGISHNTKYANAFQYYDEPPIPVYGLHTHQQPRYFSKAKAYPKLTNLPSEYINLKPEDINPEAGITQYVPNTPEPLYVQDNYDKPRPIFGDMNDNTGNKEDIDTHPSLINEPHYTQHTETLNHYIAQPSLVNKGHTVNMIPPSLAANAYGNHSKEFNLLEKLESKMAQSYQLFTLDNVRKLYIAVIKILQLNELNDSDYRALIKLRHIINIILSVAKHLQEPGAKNEWYTKIFLNAEENRHPLQLYVYNLIRQRWLHDLMLELFKKKFDIHILQKPGIFSFLNSWQFPAYVQSFIETEDFKYIDSNAPVDITNSYDDFPGDLGSYVTNKVMQSYETPNDGIVVSIAGVEAELDANAIVNILQTYWHYKNLMKNHENKNIRVNKVEMLKRIILFLKEKGYDTRTIADLIHILYSNVSLTDGIDCQRNHAYFAKKMHDVILPVLRRSGR